MNLLIYHGVLAPNAKWSFFALTMFELRRIAQLRIQFVLGPPCCSSLQGAEQGNVIEWANLMRRTFDLDVLECPECGGRTKLISLIEKPEVIKKILDHVGLPSELPAAKAARPPPEDPQLDLFDAPVDSVDDEWEYQDDPETYAE